LEVEEGSGVFTDPEKAADFVKRTGVHFLAPSFGNVHGPYPEGGAERCWQMDRSVASGRFVECGQRRTNVKCRLKQIKEKVGDETPLVLHGTHPLSNAMLQKGIDSGFCNVNQNKRVRLRYMAFLAENAGKMELTELQEKGLAIYASEIEEMMNLLGSAGKA